MLSTDACPRTFYHSYITNYAFSVIPTCEQTRFACLNILFNLRVCPSETDVCAEVAQEKLVLEAG
jgi:hypothetical protein